MQKQIIIHVGMHKTGTTFLQQDVFPRIPGVYYADRYNKEEPVTQLIKRMDQNPAALDLQQEKQHMEAYINAIDAPVVLISSENLFGYFHASYFNNQYILHVLKTLFPSARIFMSVRRQDEWFESLYRQMLHTGQSLSINQFLNYKNGQFQPWYPSKISQGVTNVYMDFSQFVLQYRRHFGEDKVLVLPYELLKTDQTAFLQQFYAFFNLETYYPPKNTLKNRSYSLISSYVALLLNRFVSSGEVKKHIRHFLQRKLDKWVYIPHSFISEKQRREMMLLHKDNNQRLSELIRIDLSQYGYY